jgi:patatin-like phospholipase/acyl hydrolase
MNAGAKKRILSIDGGGIRGIIPACTLVALEEQLKKRVRECFDFVAGTSTGALIAAAVVAGVPASRILEVYTKRSKEIFTPSGFFADVRRFFAGYKYDSANIRKVLENELGPVAAQWVMNDSPVRVLIPATCIDTKPWYFVRDHARNAGTTGKLRLVDCAVASASAPTYFKPWTMHIKGEPKVMVDGGVGVAGNPVYRACVEAFQYDDYFDPAATLVVSLGTGCSAEGDKVPGWLPAWLKWVVSALLDAAEDEQPALVRRHWPGVLKRFDWPLPYEIDMTDTRSIPELVKVGRAAAAGMDWQKILS